MAEMPDGSHILAEHVAMGWRGQATPSLMDFGAAQGAVQHTHHPPFIYDCGTQGYGCACVAPAAQQQCLLN